MPPTYPSQPDDRTLPHAVTSTSADAKPSRKVQWVDEHGSDIAHGLDEHGQDVRRYHIFF
jgi:hypothetical protein